MFRRHGGVLELSESRHGPVAARSIPGPRPLLTGFEIADSDGHAWQASPDRKVMPSKWTVSDRDGVVAITIARRSVIRLANPLGRSHLVLLDADGAELCCVLDPRDSPLARLMVSPSDWLLVRGDQPLARLGHLKREPDRQTGIRAKIGRLLLGGDPALVSFGNEHLLAAPAALTLMVVHRALIDPSAG